MLSLANVASAVCGLLGESPPRLLPPLPGATDAFEAVVVEVRLRAGPLRVDVMGAVRNAQAVMERSCPGVSLPAGVPLVWLEWDLPSPLQVVGPLRFYCLSDAILGQHAEQRPPLAPGAWRSWARQVVEGIAPDASPAWSSGLERVLSALEGDSILVHVASLAPRGVRRIRLVFAIRADRVASWLVRCRWPGDADEVGRVLEKAVLPFAWVGIQLELSPDLEGMIGIELPELRGVDAAHTAGGRYFHEAAVLGGSCTKFGEAALSRWLGGYPALQTESVRFGYVKLCRDEVGWAGKLYLGAQTPQVTSEMSAAAQSYLSQKAMMCWLTSSSRSERQES